MKITIKDDSVDLVAEPSVIIQGGKVIYTMNFTPEYNPPSEEGHFNNFDPDYEDNMERFQRMEKAFDDEEIL